MAPFSHFSSVFAKPPHKMDKIWSLENGMRKILSQKFWSLGTPLGSLRPGCQVDLDQRACRPQILFIWGPCKALVLVALLGQAKILKTAGAWCVSKIWKIEPILIKSNKHVLSKTVFWTHTSCHIDYRQISCKLLLAIWYDDKHVDK